MSGYKNKKRQTKSNTVGNIETLEHRQLMAADVMVSSEWTLDGPRDVLKINADLKGGTVQVAHHWKSACDTIVSNPNSTVGQESLRFDLGPMGPVAPCQFELPTSYVRVRAWDKADSLASLDSTLPKVDRWIRSEDVDTIRFNGSDSVDYFYNDTYLDSDMLGAAGNDVLSGGSGVDRIFGADGADEVWGNSGDDVVYGGRGADKIRGGQGADVIFGELGNDTLWGDEGNDKLYGGAGHDSVFGGTEADRIFGGAGDDKLHGGAHDDQLYAGSGKDYVRGSSGDDTLISIDGDTNDTLLGEAGFDTFWVDESGWPWTTSDDIRDASAAERKHNVHHVGSFANGADKTLDGDAIQDPTDGQHYKNFSHRPLFATNGPSARDIDQNNVGDCWLVAGLGAAAQSNQNAIYSTIVDLGDGTFGVELGGKYYRVDGDLPTRSATSNTPNFARLGEENSIWVAMIEKAYAHHHGGNQYAKLDGGLSHWVFDAIGATGNIKRSFSDGTDALNHIQSELSLGKAVVVNIDNPSKGCPCAAKHAYMVERVNFSNGKPVSVTLRNPWGVDGAGSDGLNDGLVTVTADQLAASMYWDWGIFGGGGIHSAWVG